MYRIQPTRTAGMPFHPGARYAVPKAAKRFRRGLTRDNPEHFVSQSPAQELSLTPVKIPERCCGKLLIEVKK